eukprot:gene17679-23269_t
MPNITVIRSHLFESIGKQFTDKEFDELCFEFGVEVDDVESQIIEFTSTGIKEEHIVYVIAIPANRYDLLCIEGFARAIRIFIGLESPPLFQKTEPLLKQVMHVESSTNKIRPFVVCAILRNVTFDSKKYKSFIDLQDKLHQNICRRRTLVAIGTHDFDTLQGPFRYQALKPEDIKFVPLTSDDNISYNSKELLNFYREDPSCKHLKPYTDIIYDSDVYPVIYDSNNVVISLPPIINSRHSRIQLHTKNIFIECTGVDITKANIVLDTVVTMFSEYCQSPFTVEPVEIIYEDGRRDITPLLSQRSCDAKVSEINGTIGVKLTPGEICKLCDKLQLGPATYLSDADSIRVTVPPTRSDILHAVDIIEDVAIAYGYNNIVQEIPRTLTVGAPLPINNFTDLLRAEIARAGYMEMLTHGLCSTAENFTHLRRPLGPAVKLSNPANVEYEVVRTTLLPGALKTLAYNNSISHKDGVKLFEINDVVIPTLEDDVGAINIRKFVALYSGYSAGFEIIHGLVDHIMTVIQIQPEETYALNSLTSEDIANRKRVAKAGVVYYVRSGSDPCYFPSMNAEVVLRYDNGQELVIGTLGAVHPEVLEKFEINYPCSTVELDINAIM